MIDLIENIVIDDFVSANQIFESRLNSIIERKLYEKKRMMQAEVFGGMTKAEIEARKKAGYRKASEVLGDPEKSTKLSPATKRYRATLKKKKVSEETLDELNAGKVIGYGVGKTIRGVENVARAAKLAKRLAQHSMRKSAAAKKATPEVSPGMTIDTRPRAEREAEAQAAEPKKNIITRNVNTLLGLDPDYDSKNKKYASRGGSAGSALRGAITRVGSEISSYSNLEE